MKFYPVLLVTFLMVLMSHAFAAPVFHDTHGNTVQLSALKGKWVVVNYWASWCDVCLSETQELNQFYEHYRHKNIALYGVNSDHLPLPTLKQILYRMNLLIPDLVEDPGSAWGLDDVSVLPTTFIIGPEGTVLKKIEGPNTEKSLLDVLGALGYQS